LCPDSEDGNGRKLRQKIKFSPIILGEKIDQAQNNFFNVGFVESCGFTNNRLN
jgi:hypothetical protein